MANFNVIDYSENTIDDPIADGIKAAEAYASGDMDTFISICKKYNYDMSKMQ